MIKKEKEFNKNISEQETPLYSEVACAIRQTASRKATGPGVLFTKVFLRAQIFFRTQVLRFCVRAIHYRFAKISYVRAAHDDRIVGVVDECKGQSL